MPLSTGRVQSRLRPGLTSGLDVRGRRLGLTSAPDVRGGELQLTVLRSAGRRPSIGPIAGNGTYRCPKLGSIAYIGAVCGSLSLYMSAGYGLNKLS